TPGSALSGPDTEPVSAMSGLSHQAPLVLCVPPSPELASMNVQVSPTSAGSDAMSPLRFHSFRVEQAITILQIVDAPARLSYKSCIGLRARAQNSEERRMATRTWVSGVGDDANPGSRTAPCKTFAGAISKTAAGGEIDCLDPGGFGSVTITKSLTIDGSGT